VYLIILKKFIKLSIVYFLTNKKLYLRGYNSFNLLLILVKT